MDVGELLRGELATAQFDIANAGTGVLELSAKPGCGCTLVDYDAAVPAGEHRKLTAQIRTGSLHGKFRKSIELTTNDPDQPRIRMIITGRTREAVQVLPSLTPTVVLNRAGATTTELRLRAVPGVEVTAAKGNSPLAKVTLIPGEESSYRLEITVDESAPWGRSDFLVLLSTTAADQREIAVSVHCEKGILVSPSEVTLARRSADSGGGLVATVLLRKPGGGLEILGAKCSEPGFEVRVIPVREGWLYRILATGDDATAVDPSAVLSIETGDPDQPRLEVPLRRPSATKVDRPSGGSR
jgi:hypothetical protein